MKTHDLVQGSPEWLAYRARARNASDAAAMLGCSPHMTRAELLLAMHTGMRPEPSPEQQRRFDDGHAVEAAQRPGAEEIIGEDLYPCVGSEVIDGIELSASFDGLTLAEDTGYECKTLNDELRAALDAVGDIEGNDALRLPKYFRVQMQQQCMVSGARRVLFTAATLDGNDVRRCWFYPDPALGREIVAGWKLFDEDLAKFVPVEVVDAPAPIGHSPDQLPALRSTVTGSLVLESNIKEWETAALAYIKGVREHELVTDEDFANADVAAKWCVTSKETLVGVKASLMSATGDVNTAIGTLDRIMGELDKTRIQFTNAIKDRKDVRKREIVIKGQEALAAHIKALNERLGKPYMPALDPRLTDFAGAVKGRSSLKSMQSEVDGVLTRAKLAANQIADAIDTNLRHLREHAKDHVFLFNDTAQLVLKDTEFVAMTVKTRIAEHRAAEERRLEAERERIRAEEQAKAEREAREKLQREQEEAARIQREQQDQEAAQRRQREEQEARATQQREVSVAPAPVAAQAPVALAANSPVVVPITRGKPTLRLGQINERIAPLSITAAGLEALGFKATKDGVAALYHEADFPAMVDSMVAQLRSAQQKQLEAA